MPWGCLSQKGRFAIDGVAVPIPPRRFDVTFTSVELSLGGFNVSFPLSATKPNGWVDITYLDGESSGMSASSQAYGHSLLWWAERRRSVPKLDISS